MSGSFEAELVRDAYAPRTARRLVREWFGAELPRGELDTALLLVSELVSNAVRHGKGIATVRADLNEDRLLVEVIDEGGGLERSIRRHDFEDVGGWGLRIVDAAASRWGVHEGTTHVWFELERSGPRLGSDRSPADEIG
ncbi:MAG: ATP-binding protein [Solirubrobacterales bacterium]|nr:ATP-binding protein [Solirubrobacterales bacterium]MBV9534341.1 ATP-binding protein [Solirubrobacterales bacterium]